MFYINMKNGREVETVDEFETRREARDMLAEYVMSAPGAGYYISTRATAEWRLAELEARTVPPYIVGYVGQSNQNGMGCDREAGSSNELTDGRGVKIGNVTLGNSWRVNSYIGSRMFQAYCRHKGLEYTGRTFGRGMSVVLRLTAASRREAMAAGLIIKGEGAE